MDEANVEDLLLALEKPDVAERKKTVFKIGEQKIKEAVPKLIELLQRDEDKVVRNNAARALGKIADQDQKSIIVTALCEALEDSDYYVRTNACWSLGKLKDPQAISALAKLANPSQHIYMATGDGKTDGNAVITTQEKKEEGVQYSDQIIKAIEALGEIGDPQAIPILLKGLKDQEDGTVRCAAALALGKMNSPDIVPELINALEDKYWYVRRDIIKALGNLKDERAIPPLIKKISDMYNEVKEFALKALINIGQPAHKAVFQTFLKQPTNPLLGTFIRENLSKAEILTFLEEILNEEQDENKKKILLKYIAQFSEK